MRNTEYPVTAIVSGCELFRRFITLAKLDTKVELFVYGWFLVVFGLILCFLDVRGMQTNYVKARVTLSGEVG